MSYVFTARRSLMPLLALLIVAGCAEKPAAESQDGALAKAKAEFEKELSASLDKLDAEIRDLKAKAANLQTEARTKVDQSMAEIDAKEKAARAKLAELHKSSAAAWEHLKQGSRSAWEELEEAVKKAAKEF